MRIILPDAVSAPLYQVVAEALRAMVLSGAIRPGDRLPTVRDLAKENGFSEGTARHAYDTLVREGVLESLQGRGTFARDLLSSREKLAMDAIETLLDRMESLGFSDREAGMFLSLKLSERQRGAESKPVAVVDCNPEALNEMAEQLSALPGVELTEYLLDDVRATGAELLRPFPLIVTTKSHYYELCALAGDASKNIRRVSLSMDMRTVAAFTAVERSDNAGIFCRTPRFARIVRDGMRAFPRLRPDEYPLFLRAGEASFADFLSTLRYLVVSPDYLSYASAAQQQAVNAFTRGGGTLIAYHHAIDDGSMLYIEERVRQLRNP